MRQTTAVRQTTAARHKRIVPVDEALLGRPGPRVVLGLRAMAEVMRKSAEH